MTDVLPTAADDLAHITLHRPQALYTLSPLPREGEKEKNVQ